MKRFILAVLAALVVPAVAALVVVLATHHSAGGSDVSTVSVSSSPNPTSDAAWHQADGHCRYSTDQSWDYENNHDQWLRVYDDCMVQAGFTP